MPGTVLNSQHIFIHVILAMAPQDVLEIMKPRPGKIKSLGQSHKASKQKSQDCTPDSHQNSSQAVTCSPCTWSLHCAISCSVMIFSGL